jgi:hypothetical protein
MPNGKPPRSVLILPLTRSAIQSGAKIGLSIARQPDKLIGETNSSFEQLTASFSKVFLPISQRRSQRRSLRRSGILRFFRFLV